jgi:hypothetical protein
MAAEVLKEVCEQRHQFINKELGAHSDQLQLLTETLAELGRSNATLNSVVGNLVKQIDSFTTEMKALREEQVRSMVADELKKSSPAKQSFWETNGGQKVIWAIIILAFFVVGGAIGANWMDAAKLIK